MVFKFISNDKQFEIIKNKFLASKPTLIIKKPKINDPILLIITTQRTGSTLLCSDLMQACQLNYYPGESFVGSLRFYFNNYPNFDELDLQKLIKKSLMKPIKGPLYIHKIMIDYIGWLGFFLAPKEFVKKATYCDLCKWFIKYLYSFSDIHLPIIFLDRSDKISQGTSKFINSLGAPTHIKNDSEVEKIDNFIDSKIINLQTPEAIILEKVAQLIKQNFMLDKIQKDLSGEYSTVNLNYENDLCNTNYSYLSKFLGDELYDSSLISRDLRRTSGKRNSELKESLKKIIGMV